MACNRLSLFLKENGSLRDFANFEGKGKPEISSPATETNETTVDFLSNMEFPVQTSEKTEKSVNLLPQYVSVDSFCKRHDSANKGVCGDATESKTANMTIFYRGQVFVFDHISAEKARDMMLAASSSDDDNQIQNRIPLTSTSNSPYEAFGSQDQILQVNGSDLPIARRSSLHKFLAKRKDGATERAPYQFPNRLMAATHKFDLNL